MRTRVASVVLLFLAQSNAQQELKGSLSKCLNSGGSSLNSCLSDLAERLRPYMKSGLPDYGVPPTEPMFIDRIQLKLAKPPIDVTVTFEDTTVKGLSGFRINSVRASQTSQTIQTNITIPTLTAEGRYAMTGQAFVSVDESKGPYSVRLSEVTSVLNAKLSKENGRLIIRDDPEVTVKIGSLNVNLENLFGGKTPQFARAITKFINEESDEFIKDFGPQITSQVSKLAKEVYNAAVNDLDPSLFGLQ